MFVGHYAPALLVKAMAPRLPAWAALGATQLVDIAWAGLVLADIEKVRIDPNLPGSPLDLYFMPWTHSLPGALAWSLVAGLIASRIWGRAGWWLLPLVFSHWLLDLVVHRPDLPLGFTGPKLGLGLWNLPVVEAVTEIGLLGAALGVWVAARKGQGLRATPAIALFGLLVLLQITGALPSDTAPTPTSFAWLAWFGYGVSILGGALVDWRDRR